MRVHIVTRDAKAQNILGRLIRELITQSDWTADDAPDATADLNYAFPYLEWSRFPNFRATPTAAWFTHRDIGRPNKVDAWDQTAKRVDVRTTSARLYAEQLALVGSTFLVTPPLDIEKFKPAARHTTRAKPVVGTSGFVYAGGRKGEELIAALAASRLAERVKLIACGKGWPISTDWYEWDQMHKFYQKLDVYVCTSHIEGIGYGPLEAMACGIPVVIPRGVGVFDELPDVQNLFRYDAGDFEGMQREIQNALDEPINVESLRGVSMRFTTAAWHETHRAAFAHFNLSVPPVPKKLPAWRERAAVVYVAYGTQARECAQRAMVSLRDQMPGLPVCLVSDAKIGLEDVFIEHADTDIGARSVKTKINELVPEKYQYILYLDADTEVVQPIGFIFDLLADGWEFVICINPAQYALAREMRRPDNLDEIEETFALLGTDEILQYNGGVFAFRRNERTALLMSEWHREWDRYGKRDQAALDRALYTNPVRVYTLGNEWNTITRYMPAERTAGILHYPMTARRWAGRITGRLDKPEAWAAVHPDRTSEPPKRRKGLSR